MAKKDCIQIGNKVIMDNETKWRVVSKFTMGKTVKKGTKAVILKSKDKYCVFNESNFKRIK